MVSMTFAAKRDIYIYTLSSYERTSETLSVFGRRRMLCASERAILDLRKLLSRIKIQMSPSYVEEGERENAAADVSLSAPRGLTSSRIKTESFSPKVTDVV